MNIFFAIISGIAFGYCCFHFGKMKMIDKVDYLKDQNKALAIIIHQQIEIIRELNSETAIQLEEEIPPEFKNIH